ncbi:MAG: hypothetical protein ABMA64_37050, partial [Myxococcota bacterium]
AYPASPPIYQDPEKLAQKVRQTDSALGSWRNTSDQRRQAYVESRVKAEAELARRRRRVMLGSLGVGLGCSAAAAAIVWALQGPTEHTLPPSTPVAAAESAPPVSVQDPPATVPAAVVAPAVVAPDAAAVVAPDAAAVVAPSAVDAPAVAPAIEVAPAVVSPAVDGSWIEAGTVRVWNDSEHQWVAFDTRSTATVGVRYFDGAGAPALEPKSCPKKGVDGVRHCAIGRTVDRLNAAIAAGSAPGSWRAEACASPGTPDERCAEVGRFEVR